MDQAKAIAPPPDSASTMSSTVEGTKATTLARKILSCLKSLTIWEFGTATIPMSSTARARTLIGRTAATDPSTVAMGPAKAIMAPANMILDKIEMVATVG